MPSASLRSLQDPETLRVLVRNLKEGVYITSLGGEFLDANPALLEIFGAASLEELREQPLEDLIDLRRRAKQHALLERDGAVRDFEYEIHRPDGEHRTVLDTCSMVTANGGERLVHGIMIDITHRKALETQLREMSIRDPLTGCYNRRHLGELERKYGGPTEHWGAVVIDVDHFKDYNDKYGHQAGDDVLIRLSRFLMQHVRAEDVVVRMGGDEFLILLFGENTASTEFVAKRLTGPAADTAPVSFSIGWAVREEGETMPDTISRADQDLILVRVKERTYHKERKSRN